MSGGVFNHLERCCQLHERVTLLYTVDGYIATLLTADGDKEYLSQQGPTAYLAMRFLNDALSDTTLEQVRAKQ